MTEEEQTPWMTWVVKSLIVVFMTILPPASLDQPGISPYRRNLTW